MRKVENVKILGPSSPDELGKEYLGWMKKMCEEREKNVAVGSVAFYTDIISRSLMPVEKGKFSLAVFYYDYLLQPHEKGGPSHHPDEGEGASAIGPDVARKRR
jgi:hypothetical protein